MAKRYREFRRINLTANVAGIIQENLVDKTFNDHLKKCWNSEDCCHIESGNLAVARLVEVGITVGKKRGYLDIQCPYSLSDPKGHVKALAHMAYRLSAFAKTEKNPRTRTVMERVAEEIDNYAHRNAMEIIAEQVVDVDFERTG